jgi:hypothetical protein
LHRATHTHPDRQTWPAHRSARLSGVSPVSPHMRFRIGVRGLSTFLNQAQIPSTNLRLQSLRFRETSRPTRLFFSRRSFANIAAGGRTIAWADASMMARSGESRSSTEPALESSLQNGRAALQTWKTT